MFQEKKIREKKLQIVTWYNPAQIKVTLKKKNTNGLLGLSTFQWVLLQPFTIEFQYLMGGIHADLGKK